MSYLLPLLALLATITLILYVISLDQPKVEDSLAHWHVTIPGLTVSHDRFYAFLTERVDRLKLEGVQIEQYSVYEGHVATFTRPYFRVRRGNLRYFVFAAPLGESFFVSSWLIYQRATFLRVLLGVPVLGWLVGGLVRLLSADTLYQYDAALHFLEILHHTTVDVVDVLVSKENAPPLSAEAKKPILRDVYASARPQAPKLAL